MNQIPWYILGAGSMGCLWACALAEAGESVTLIVREDKWQGDVVELRYQRDGEQKIFAVNVTTPIRLSQPIEQLIVTTKSYDVLAAMESVRLYLSPEAFVLLLQNGMGAQQQIISKFPQQTVWVGSSTDGAYLTTPFSVVHAGQGVTYCGPLEKSSGNIAPVFPPLLLNVEVVSDMPLRLWRKLAVNCGINGLTALFGCKNGELLDGGERQVRLDALLAETTQLLEVLAPEPIEAKTAVYDVCRVTANNYSSTHQDVWHGRQTELAFINGFLIEQAKARGLSAPLNEQLLRDLAAK